VIKDDDGNVIELRCTYDPATRGGDAPDGRKVKGTIHWVSKEHAVPAEMRLYEHLFTQEDPQDVPEGKDFTDTINPDSLTLMKGFVEPCLADRPVGWQCQFERRGYFCIDPDSTPGKLVVNRTVGLRDTWAKIQKQQNRGTK
jgi:glutaminyl-tRNA synthetase